MAQGEIIFLVEESLEGGLEARALVHSIYSEADTLGELKEAVRDVSNAEKLSQTTDTA